VTAVRGRAQRAAEALMVEIEQLPMRNTPAIRALRKRHGRAWEQEPAAFLVEIALALTKRRVYRWVGYELVRARPEAFRLLNDRLLRRLAQGLDGWDSVDAFARILAGPAWAQGLASDGLFRAWARSPDRWLRRAALVSTIALNVLADGGRGDTSRTLEICEALAGDPDDMVHKALSWALRVLIASDPAAVSAFVTRHDQRLAARVRREVDHKLRTGLKSPRKSMGVMQS
jgi:3-methyladenine DNA glycosylase AlkD